MLVSFLATLLLCAAGALPPKTVSHECPAIDFSADYYKQRERFFVSFKPAGDHRFAFVDVHIAIFEGAQQVGEQKNLKMYRDEPSGDFVAEIQDPEMIHVWGAPAQGKQLRFSFTYCVGLGTHPVDCDTESFPIVTMTYNWKSLEVSCPTQCGLSMTQVSPEAVCVGSDGHSYDDASCAAIPYPPAVMCPATQPCVNFAWRMALAECPTECGLPASQLNIPVTCMGSDGQKYPASECAGIPTPEPIRCPATSPCMQYHWHPLPVACPADCGLQASEIPIPAICHDQYENEHAAHLCHGLPRPSPQACPATPPCVTYNWRAALADCPTQCGMPMTILAPALSCIGSDGLEADPSMCDAGAMPGDQQCPPTAPCAVDCEVSDWSDWGACTASCDGGETSRYREIIQEAQAGGASCPALQETSMCNTSPCPPDVTVVTVETLLPQKPILVHTGHGKHHHKHQPPLPLAAGHHKHGLGGGVGYGVGGYGVGYGGVGGYGGYGVGGYNVGGYGGAGSYGVGAYGNGRGVRYGIVGGVGVGRG